MISCCVCGRLFQQLQSHIKVHGLTSKEYKTLFPDAALMSQEEKDKISVRMKSGQAIAMAGKSKGCKKPNLSKVMHGNKRGLGTNRSAERERYVEQAKKQHREGNFGSWDEARRKRQASITRERWRTGSLKHNWKPKWELELAEYLEERKLRFLPQFRGISPGCSSKPFDFYLPDYNLLIELQGCFWHGCRRCYNPHPIQVRVMKNDLHKEEFASKNRFRLLRIWEHDKDKLYKIVEQSMKTNNFLSK